MAEEATLPPGEIRNIAERALVLQSLLLRRAWGNLYATWSTAMFVTLFVTPIVSALFPDEFTIVPHVLVNMIVSGSAVIAILWEFRRVRNTDGVRRAIVDRRWSRPLGYRAMVPLWVTIYAALILTVVFFRPQAVSVILVVYAVLAAYLYYALRLSFRLKLPAEGIAALSSLVIAITGTVALSFLVRNTAPYGALWISTVVIWLLAAAYARTRPLWNSTEDQVA